MKRIIFSILFAVIFQTAQSQIYKGSELVENLNVTTVDTAWKVSTESLGYQTKPELPYTNEKRVFIKSFNSFITFDVVNIDKHGKATSGLLYFFCIHGSDPAKYRYELQAVIYDFK